MSVADVAPYRAECGVPMKSFVHESMRARTIFGAGTLSLLPSEVDSMALRRCLVISSVGQDVFARRVTEMLGDRTVHCFSDAVQHTPVEVTQVAESRLHKHRADGIVSIGGGSATGLGKALAFRSKLPHLVIPTTYAGSEMTPILGETSKGLKKTIRDPLILPSVVIYDVDLTLDMPIGLTVASAMNAIAHSVEALYTRERNPVYSLLAEDSIRSLADALPRLVQNPHDPEARWDALYGAWLAGTCLGSVGMALHHKLCHTLGGIFDLPHAETHMIVLPHVVAYNAYAAPEAIARLRRALSSPDPAGRLQNIARQLGGPTSLRDVGMPESGIEIAAEQAVREPYWNPAPFNKETVRGLLRKAWEGAVPTSPPETAEPAI